MVMSKNTFLKVTVGLVVAVVGLGVFQYLRPLPAVSPTATYAKTATTPAIVLPWPNYGQSALGAPGYGVLTSAGAQTPAPIASVAKVFTALSVLKQKPLAVGDKGPLITLDKTDLDYYNYYYSNDGSVAKIAVGEQLSEYEALQALLLPSANNIADSLARWAFGSTDAYVAYANQLAKDLGLTQTTIGSPSGFTANTTSTATDLVRAGLVALSNPVMAEIVGQQKADITVAGTVHNVNWLLGLDGVNGIKTGNTTEAGGCYLYSAVRQVAGKNIQIVGSIMGAPDLNQAIKAARPILAAGDGGFENSVVIKKGQLIGSYKTSWGSTSNAIASQDVTILAWKGQELKPTITLSRLDGLKPAGTTVGKIVVRYNESEYSSPIILENKIAKPSVAWQIFRR